jgi:hypothetical protein
MTISVIAAKEGQCAYRREGASDYLQTVPL